MDFYQLKVSFETVTKEELDPRGGIERAAPREFGDVVRTTNFSLEDLGTDVDDAERGEEPAAFSQWLYGMVKSSFGFLSMEQLSEYSEALRGVFDTITYERDGVRCFSSKYDRMSVEAKGELYANDPKFKDKRAFMESEFLRLNNEAFGYERFEYLYLEDAMPDNERIVRTRDIICEFFGG